MCSLQQEVLNLSWKVVEGLHAGSGLNKQRAACIVLTNPGLEDPVAHRYLVLAPLYIASL